VNTACWITDSRPGGSGWSSQPPGWTSTRSVARSADCRCASGIAAISLRIAEASTGAMPSEVDVARDPAVNRAVASAWVSPVRSVE